MKIMIDSNVILSALLFPSGTVGKAFEKCVLEHYLILCNYIIDECKRVVVKKFSNHINDLNDFFATYSIYPCMYTY